MIEIAGGIVLAVAFLCALPFLLVAAVIVFYAVLLLGWVPLLGAGWWAYAQGGREAQDLGGGLLIFGGMWLFFVLWAFGRDLWEDSRKCRKPQAPPPPPPPSEAPKKRGFALPSAGWKPSAGG